MRYSLLVFLAALGFAACRRDADSNAGMNQAPTAAVNVKDYVLSDSTNLVSTIRLYWTGSDVDGWLKGFRISVNDAPYSPLLTRTDSLFRFSLTPGNITETVRFRVIAVDDKDAESEPALLTLPIRNTPPVASFNTRQVPRGDSVLGVISLPVSAADADGNETVESMSLRVNGGEWLPLPPSTLSVTIAPQDPRVTGPQPAVVYLNASLTQVATRLQGLVVDGTNLFELKARDLASAESEIARIVLAADGTPKQYYFRRITSDLLVLDAHSGIAAPTPESIYFPTLNRAYPQGYDYVDLVGNAGANQQRLFTPSMTVLLNNYKKVFWYSDNSRATNRIDSLTVMLETAAPVLTAFYSQPGKHVLLSNQFLTGTNRPTASSPLFQVLPVDSLLQASNAARLSRNRAITARIAGYPDLLSLTAEQGGIQEAGITSFYPGPLTDSLYSAPLTAVPPGVSRAVGGRFPRGNSHPSLIFFTMDLHKLAGSTDRDNLPEFTQFFQNALNRDFND